MSLLSNILSGAATIFGGAAGPLLGGVINSVAGGSSSSKSGSTAVSAGSQTSSRLSQLLAQKAFMEGYQASIQQAFDPKAAMTSNPTQQATPSVQPGNEAQQAGGQIGVPFGQTNRPQMGYQSSYGPGLGGGGSTASHSATTTTPATTATTTTPYTVGATDPRLQAYQQYQLQALQGRDTLPQNAYAQAMTQGQAGINSQAQMASQKMLESMASRGLLNSGVRAAGQTGIEQARLGGLSSLYGGLQQQQLAAQRESQQRAMELYAAERESQYGRDYGYEMQKRSEPGFWDQLGGAASQWAQYQYGPDANTYQQAYQKAVDPYGKQYQEAVKP